MVLQQTVSKSPLCVGISFCFVLKCDVTVVFYASVSEIRICVTEKDYSRDTEYIK